MGLLTGFFRSDREEKLEESITRLGGEIGILQHKLQILSNILGRSVFPEEALNDLTGELRAVRYLMDTNKEYAFIDRESAKRKPNVTQSREETSISNKD